MTKVVSLRDRTEIAVPEFEPSTLTPDPSPQRLASARIFFADPEKGRSLGTSLLGTGRVARSAGWGLPAKAPPHPARPAAEPPSPLRGRIDAAHLARKKMCANASRNREGGAKRRVGYSGKAPPHPARPAAEPPSPLRGRIDAAHLARKKMCANASRNREGGAKRRVGTPAKALPHPARPVAEPPSPLRGRIRASFLVRSKMRWR